MKKYVCRKISSVASLISWRIVIGRLRKASVESADESVDPRYDERCRHAVPRDVADDQVEPAVGGHRRVEIVAADERRRDLPDGHLHVGPLDALGDQRPVHRLRELQLGDGQLFALLQYLGACDLLVQRLFHALDGRPGRRARLRRSPRPGAGRPSSASTPTRPAAPRITPQKTGAGIDRRRSHAGACAAQVRTGMGSAMRKPTQRVGLARMS